MQWEKRTLADVYVALQLVHGQCLARSFLAHRANSSDWTCIMLCFFLCRVGGALGLSYTIVSRIIGKEEVIFCANVLISFIAACSIVMMAGNAGALWAC